MPILQSTMDVWNDRQNQLHADKETNKNIRNRHCFPLLL